MKRFYLSIVCSIFTIVCIAMLAVLQTNEDLALQYMSFQTYAITLGILALLITMAIILLIIQIFKMNTKK